MTVGSTDLILASGVSPKSSPTSQILPQERPFERGSITRTTKGNWNYRHCETSHTWVRADDTSTTNERRPARWVRRRCRPCSWNESSPSKRNQIGQKERKICHTFSGATGRCFARSIEELKRRGLSFSGAITSSAWNKKHMLRFLLFSPFSFFVLTSLVDFSGRQLPSQISASKSATKLRSNSSSSRWRSRINHFGFFLRFLLIIKYK